MERQIKEETSKQRETELGGHLEKDSYRQKDGEAEIHSCLEI